VNLACRLEALTRRFPEHPILVSAALRALLPADWPVVDLGEQRLKGWPEPIGVFALGDPATAGETAGGCAAGLPSGRPDPHDGPHPD
jgi:class 3 adenylate cyclase